MPSSITLLSASAGSGKTHALTKLLAEEIAAGVRPEGVAATTFTRKAADELTARVRTTLLTAGRPSESRRIRDGYIGTVNAVCGSILRDFAFEAGLSPSLEVLPDGEDSSVFRTAIAEVVQRYAKPLGEVCTRLEMADGWVDLIKAIADKARVNGIDRARLAGCVEQSWASLRSLLPEPLDEGAAQALERELVQELDAAIGQLPAVGDTTKTTQQARDALLGLKRALRDGRPGRWSDWERMARVTPGKKSEDIVAPLRDLAAQALTHPLLHRDLEIVIRLFFECAADALGRYQQHKKDLGLMDFIDQEMEALKLLGQDVARQRLEERLELLLVDEFQDTSPIQLALFLRLSEAAGKAVFVGDRKQSIFAFRGTDPVLMEAVMQSLGRAEVLDKNWRSQPSLVAFTSEFFSLAMARHGIPEKEVRLEPQVPPIAPEIPRLNCWRLDTRNQADDWAALAAGIQQVLAEPDRWPVLDRHSKRQRFLRPGDIAVLCAKNSHRKALAAALEKIGVRAATAAPGIMQQPETTLALAAFRVLTDEDDLLALAELARLLPVDGDPAWWLPLCVKGDLSGVVAQLEPARRLAAHRSDLARLTVAESLDMALDLADVRQAVLCWNDAGKRLANLDALRGLVTAYEELCTSRRIPCTPAGLFQHLDELEGAEEDSQAEGLGEDAVQILTYHRAKGLEWPLVILTGLDTPDKYGVFGLDIVTPSGRANLVDPLAGRWLRYWPWPFGGLGGPENLNEAVESSQEMANAREQAERERLRLLYVGMTRARDHMVFAARLPKKDGTATSWIDACIDTSGQSILSLPTEEGDHDVTVGMETFPVAVRVFSPGDTELTAVRSPRWVSVQPKDPVTHPAARFAPNTERLEDEVSAELVTLGPALDMPKATDPARLGSAVHACLAAVPLSGPQEERLARIAEVLAGWGIDTLPAEAVCAVQDRLAGFVMERYPEASTVVEWPIHLRRGLRRGNGWVDMLLRLPEGNVIIDHKTVMGDPELLRAKAVGYAGQLAVYGEALAKSTGRPTLAMWVHFPLTGAMVKVDVSPC